MGEETELPYDKPPLSKSVLAGSADEDSIRLLTQEQADAEDIQLLLGHRAVDLDVAENLLKLEGHDPPFATTTSSLPPEHHPALSLGGPVSRDSRAAHP